MSLMQYENRVGNPIKTGRYKIVPIEASLQMQPPGMRTFCFWRKPASVIVQHPDGIDQVLQIPDITRQAQIGLISFALIFSAIFWLITRMQQNEDPE